MNVEQFAASYAAESEFDFILIGNAFYAVENGAQIYLGHIQPCDCQEEGCEGLALTQVNAGSVARVGR